MATFRDQVTVTTNGESTIVLDATDADVSLGGHGQHGTLRLLDGSGRRIMSVDVANADFKMGGLGTDADITLFPSGATDIRGPAQATIHLAAKNADLSLGGNGQHGTLRLLDGNGRRIMSVDAANADFKMGGLGTDGDITLFPRGATDIATPAQATIHLDGESGDIKLMNADAAEDFDVADAEHLEPGDVAVIGEDAPQRVERSRRPYDSRVVGVVAGARGHRPGIILGRDLSREGRVPIALIGLVWTKADATVGSISVGDLLTTSSRPGHAMRIRDSGRAFGAVLGKAMAQLEAGTGLVPVLVALQ